jgi:hypothetical protein
MRETLIGGFLNSSDLKVIAFRRAELQLERSIRISSQASAPEASGVKPLARRCFWWRVKSLREISKLFVGRGFNHDIMFVKSDRL